MGSLWTPNPPNTSSSAAGSAPGPTPPDLPALALWLIATMGIVFGGMSAVVASGTLPPAVTFTGVPSFGVTKSFEVTITTTGIVGTAKFSWFHNGALVASGVTVAATVLLTDGITANFPPGTYTAGDDWQAVPVVASWTSQDASATVFAQATLADMPQWIAPGPTTVSGFAAGPNNQATVRGDGSASDLASSFAQAQPCSIYAALVPRGGSAAAMWLGDSAGGNYSYFSPAPPAATALTIVIGGATVGSSSSTINFPVAAMLFSAIVDGASSQFPISHSLSPQGAGDWTAMHLFSINGAADYYGGDIAELLITGNSISPANDSGIRLYFCNRYALS